MGVDRYTKTVLTIIAAALCALVVQNTIPASHAQQGTTAAGAVQRVALCDVSGTRCAAVEAGLGRGAESGGLLRVLGEMRTLR